MKKRRVLWLKIMLLSTLTTILVIAEGWFGCLITGQTAEAIDANQQMIIGASEEDLTAENETYIVQEKDTLWDIAAERDIRAELIVKANNLQNPAILQIGQELIIPSGNIINYEVRSGESLSEIAVAFGDEVAALTERNGLNDANVITVGQNLIICPQEQNALSGTDETFVDDKALDSTEQNDNAVVSTTSSTIDKSDNSMSTEEQNDVLVWPVTGEISSYYGMREGSMHEGLDIAVAEGTVVKAAMAGVVSYVGEISGYGLTVMVKHDNDLETLYAHNSQLLVSEGERVTGGRALALSGNTGKSTGPHVHFEIRVSGKACDPLEYL